MKKFIFPVLASAFFCSTAGAQTKPAVKKTVPAPKAVLKTVTDSASYGIGLSVINFYKQQGISNLKPELVAQAIRDVQAGKKPLLDDMQANSVVMKLMNSASADKAKKVIEEGEKFLAQNKKRPEVTTTASGLQFEVVKKGDGPRPTPEDRVVCHYTGRFIDGNKFESSLDSGQPITFALNGVVAGWTEGLQLMPVGSKYIFYIPHQLGYGTMDNGPIPGGSVLIFEIDLLEIKK